MRRLYWYDAVILRLVLDDFFRFSKKSGFGVFLVHPPMADSKAHRDGDPGEICSDLYRASVPDIRPSWWVFTNVIWYLGLLVAQCASVAMFALCACAPLVRSVSCSM